MGFWNNRRDRWAKQALDRLWSDEAPPWRPGLGPSNLSEALSDAPTVQRHYSDLVEADTALKRSLGITGATGLSDADRALLGLDEEDEAPAPTHTNDFEARVHGYLAQAQLTATSGQPSRWPVAGFVLALAGAAAVLFFLLNGRSVEQANMVQVDRDNEWTIRGAGTTDAPPPVEVSALCLSPTAPRVRPASDDAGAIRCRLSDSLQLTITNPEGRPWTVGVFAVFPDKDPLPYGPTPANLNAPSLTASPKTQPLGRPRKLAVNHTPGAGWLVTLGTEGALSYTAFEAAMGAWTDTTADQANATAPELERRTFVPMARAMNKPLAFVRVTPLIIEPNEEPP